MPTQEKNNLGETTATNNVNKPVKPKPKNKKPSVDNVKDGVNNPEYRPLEGAGSPGPAGNKISPTDWFTSEIQDMMYGFGDCSTPMLESAQMIEEIVRQQMSSLLLQGTDVALLRNNYSKVVGPEDIIFLMRKDKVKLYRLIKYMEVKDLKGVYRSNSIEEEDGEMLSDNKQALFKSKRFKLCQDFINSIDTTGELSSMFDEEVFDDIKFERNQRLEQRTRCMDQHQYLEFCKARQSSFSKKFRSTKFRDWLMKDNSMEIKITASAVELFNYMAYETVAQIIDLALLIKKESKPEGGDPLNRATTGISYNPEFPSVHLTNYTNKLIGPHRPDSPAQTPSSPPLSPSMGTSQGSNSNINKLKAKKRRKSETKNGCDNVSGCIEPHVIREAIQRYFRQSGAFSLFLKSQHSILPTRLMCC